jgi:hypothetical protein
MNDRKKGDKVWYIPGYRAKDLIVIHCAIIDVDDTENPFYWLDEPIGHSVGESDIYDKLEHAETELRFRYVRARKEAEDDNEDPPGDDAGNLELFRKTGKSFIVKTHEAHGGKHPGFSSEMCPPKKAGKDWFNIALLKKN